MPTSAKSMITRKDVEELIDEKPVEALEKARDQLEEKEDGHRKTLYRSLQNVLEITIALYEEPVERKRFVEHEFWRGVGRKKPSTKDSFKELLLSTARFFFRAQSTKGLRYNRAYKYARALLAYHEAGVEVEDIAKRLKEDHGVDAVFAAAAEEPDQSPQEEDGAKPGKSPTAGKASKPGGGGKSKPQNRNATGGSAKRGSPGVGSADEEQADDEDDEELDVDANGNGSNDDDDDDNFDPDDLRFHKVELLMSVEEFDMLEEMDIHARAQLVIRRIQDRSRDGWWRFFVTRFEAI